MRWFLSLLLATALLALGCVGGAFNAAVREDTAAAYHRFLREHPDSSQAEEARQHLALVRIRSKPTAEAWDEFLKRWPDSPLLPELRPLVAQVVFERARARGSAEAYREFLAQFGDSDFAARARGNLAYVEERGMAGRPDALAAFAEAYPESDYAAEAKRSAAAVASRGGSAFQRVGLVISLSPSTPGKQRLARAFAERASAAMQAVGVQVVPLTGPDDPRAAALPVRLSIHHEEGPVATEVEAGTVTSSGILAKTTVTLAEQRASRPIWSRTTSFKVSGSSSPSDTSVLFGPGTQRYWSSFFVPVATWNTRIAVRTPASLDRPIVAVQTQGERGFVLYKDGSFSVVDLSDPEKPWVFAIYERPRDLASFEGLRLIGNRAVIFGQDGIEIVALDGGALQRVRRLDRGSVGAVTAVEPLAGGLVLGGPRGLLFVPEGGAPEAVLARPVRGLALSGTRLVFTDGASVFVAPLDLLRRGRVEGDLPLGPGVQPYAIRSAGNVAVVLSRVGALRLDLSNPREPKVASRIAADGVGELRDAVLAGGRIFLLGERGLQVSDPRGTRVVESADVAARASLDPMGRHLVMVGEHTLQVVDTTPFVAGDALASPQVRGR